jgi:hypothetical protein
VLLLLQLILLLRIILLLLLPARLEWSARRCAVTRCFPETAPVLAACQLCTLAQLRVCAAVSRHLLHQRPQHNQAWKVELAVTMQLLLQLS